MKTLDEVIEKCQENVDLVVRGWDEEDCFLSHEYMVDMLHYLKEYRKLPSAEPERKRGIWQRRKGDDCWECSECHSVLERDDLGQHNFYFCYHCGADMCDGKGYYNIEEEDDEDS